MGDDAAAAMPESRATGSSDIPSSRLAFLRHPLVVGAAVAIISAFFASLLIPSITHGQPQNHLSPGPDGLGRRGIHHRRRDHHLLRSPRYLAELEDIA